MCAIPFLYWQDVTLPTEILPRRKIKVGDQKYSDPCLPMASSIQTVSGKKKSRIRCVFPIVFFFAENFFSPLHFSFTFFLSLSLSCSLCRLCLTSKRRTIKYWESSIMGSVPWDKRVFGSMCKWFRMYNTLEIGIKIWIYVFDYGR